ncbi:extracellular solute-binding protein [Halomonas sp. WWR20]
MHKMLKILAVSTALLSWAMQAEAQTQQIEWWDFFTGGDGVRMKSLIKEFNEAHPNIQINATSLEWGNPFYTKVNTSTAVGQGPDVMSYHLSHIPAAVQAGTLSEITAADLEEAGLSKNDFHSRSIQAATINGKIYGVPLDIHSIVLYYNKRLLEGSRFLDDNKLTGIESVEDFEEALSYAKEKGSESPLSYATSDDGGVWRVFYTLLAQQNGEFIEDGEILPGDNADKAAKAINTMARWQENGWTPEQASYSASVALFSAGKSAFHLNGVWEVPTFTDLAERDALGFDWAAVQLPALMKTQATWADSHAFAIPNEGDDTVSGEKRKAVMEAIGWMERHAIQWANAGHIPAYKPITQSVEYQKMDPNATYSPLVETAVYDPPSEITGVGSPTYDAAINIISPAIHGYMSGADAVEMLKEQLQPLLN